VCQRGGKRVVGNGIYEAVAESLVGMEFFGSEKHLQGAGLADDSRKSLRAAPARNETQGRAAVSEDGLRACDAMAAGEGEVETSAHTVAMNGGNRGGGETSNGLH
jgi:hypothetical protein